MTNRTRTHILVQFTDTHLVDDGERLYGVVDSDVNLQRGLDMVGGRVESPDAILLTGDLANDGTVSAYRRLRTIVEDASARLGVPAYYGMGNHDHRDAFRAELLDGAPAPVGTVYGATESDGQRDEFAPVDYVVEVAGLRIVMVDSTVPGHHYGELTAEQIDWLRSVLAEPAPAGTVLTIHHPPYPLRTTGPDAELMAAASFPDIDPLADAVRDTDVMLVLAGHYHEPMAGRIGGVPVWSGASTAMAHEVSEDMAWFRIVPGSGFTVIDVYDDATAIVRAVDCLERPVLMEMSMDTLRQQVTGGGGAELAPAH